ncbi:YabP/YqfC family sporulation protein [Metaclostridioides mangenotii]|uniref:YabP/YqfC family sporulation protein n=1 Tax=Metaclostridioides mangenotii TaxID=1540 RepID=UPI000466868F|nr:YabP/YqfC family sporulation protein [Clostridioides mangenotii]
MLDISADLQVNQPIVTITGSTFVSVENYLSIIEFEQNSIKIKTKIKTVKITGDKLSLKFITDTEIGIKGLIFGVELIDD